MKKAGMFLLMIAFAHFVWANPFEHPKGTEIVNQDKSGKTWAMNGSVKMSFVEAKKELCKSLEKAGWKLKHDICLDEKEKNHSLLYWMKGKENLLLQIWFADGKTFFSWGIIKE